MVLRPGGFPEYNPAEQIIFDQIQKIIEKNYIQYGYAHIQTPAVEANSVLLSKNGEDAGKQIFGLYGLAQGKDDTKEYSLHFDLTVPFARYVLDHENDIVFPFKRYQIQPSRRGERSQRGRFKELWQADIDVIWNDQNAGGVGKYLFYDSETLFVLLKTLEEIKTTFLPKRKISMHINNRYLLSGFLEQFAVDPKLIYSLFDRYYKIGQEKFIEELAMIGLSTVEQKKIIAFTTTKLADLTESSASSEKFVKGLTELKEVMKHIDLLNVSYDFSFVYDPFIVRGLDYYTGTVYEVYFDDDMGLGSISGGGRYENLTGYIDPKKNFYSGVGGSIGLSRMTFLILETIKTTQATVADYLFVNFESTIADIYALVTTFVNEGKNIEIYPTPDKLAKQFAYADKKGIPNVVILGEGELKDKIYKIKHMKTGEETTVNL
ncbi:MAG: ATP phosphoribosyltransferase regulatory subunit [candidate division SR1 bacterium]|nr:ATP phosphoribosyltransferase regulatory subunit [candidate division SR1 bacterium]